MIILAFSSSMRGHISYSWKAFRSVPVRKERERERFRTTAHFTLHTNVCVVILTLPLFLSLLVQWSSLFSLTILSLISLSK